MAVSQQSVMPVKEKFFGLLSDGREVTEYTLTNPKGISVKVLNYGGIIRSLEVPDRTGQPADIVLGFDTLEPYESGHPYFGAIIGRVAGRIGKGRLPINGVVHQLPVNSAPNHHHGGQTGFDHRLWVARVSPDNQSLRLSYLSPEGEEGYPGRLLAKVTYTLTTKNNLIVDFSATTDAATVVNMTQHSYFNLSGDLSTKVHDHELTVRSDRVLELDQHAIPTGKVVSITGSHLDFRTPRKIGDRINLADSIPGQKGLDHYWVCREGDRSQSLKLVAELCHQGSGRAVHIATTAPGVQIYSGSKLPENLAGKRKEIYGPSSGICFETQVHPDSPNHPEFPSILIRPGEVYRSTTEFRFCNCPTFK